MENCSEQTFKIEPTKINAPKKHLSARSADDKQKRIRAELFLERRRLRSLLGDDSLEFDHW